MWYFKEGLRWLFKRWYFLVFIALILGERCQRKQDIVELSRVLEQERKVFSSEVKIIKSSYEDFQKVKDEIINKYEIKKRAVEEEAIKEIKESEVKRKKMMEEMIENPALLNDILKKYGMEEYENEKF